MSDWTHIMTAEEIAARHAFTATLDPNFARRDQAWWEARTAAECDAEARGAWLCNDSDHYKVARSYAALKRAAAA